MCGACDARDEPNVSDWFAHVWFLYQLQEGGYPFRQNDLTIDEWLGLAELRAALAEPPEQ